jgi:NAD(P)-dependent dehydrogenase (short-subunit alcohol dehydrogenase family)
MVRPRRVLSFSPNKPRFYPYFLSFCRYAVGKDSDYGPYKVRCNAVCLGATRTEMLEEAVSGIAKEMVANVEETFKEFSSHVPLRKVSEPAEMTGVCVSLASDDSSFMTGAVLVVDGGAPIVDAAGASIS